MPSMVKLEQTYAMEIWINFVIIVIFLAKTWIHFFFVRLDKIWKEFQFQISRMFTI